MQSYKSVCRCKSRDQWGLLSGKSAQDFLRSLFEFNGIILNGAFFWLSRLMVVFFFRKEKSKVLKEKEGCNLMQVKLYCRGYLGSKTHGAYF